MPTYQYQCRDCGYGFEQFQKFSEDPLSVCPECGGAVQRVIQNVGVVFKGSGWYINDSRKPASTSNGSEDAPAAKKDSKGSTEAPAKSSTDASAKKEPAAATATKTAPDAASS